jgi:ABC-type Mn2+/Zn2+ transport system ATPase subunit
VEEVILSGLSIQKSLTSRFTPEQREKGKQIIARMGLEGLESRSIGQLSGGQLQRALLGRAIISDPAVLILDEPSTYIETNVSKHAFMSYWLKSIKNVPLSLSVTTLALYCNR